MRKGIKIVSVLVLCVLLCGIFIACSSTTGTSGSGAAAQGGDTEQNGAASVEGKWNIKSVTDAEGTVEGEELVTEMGEIYYEFQSGGKFVAGAAGQEVLGSWEQNGAEVKFEANGESSTALIDGDTLTIEANGATTVFTRE